MADVVIVRTQVRSTTNPDNIANLAQETTSSAPYRVRDVIESAQGIDKELFVYRIGATEADDVYVRVATVYDLLTYPKTRAAALAAAPPLALYRKDEVIKTFDNAVTAGDFALNIKSRLYAVCTAYQRRAQEFLGIDSEMFIPGGVQSTSRLTGRTIWSGGGAPDRRTGLDGDFYVDTGTYRLYGPKADGAWAPQYIVMGQQTDVLAEIDRRLDAMEATEGQLLANLTDTTVLAQDALAGITTAVQTAQTANNNAAAAVTALGAVSGWYIRQGAGITVTGGNIRDGQTIAVDTSVIATKAYVDGLALGGGGGGGSGSGNVDLSAYTTDVELSQALANYPNRTEVQQSYYTKAQVDAAIASTGSTINATLGGYIPTSERATFATVTDVNNRFALAVTSSNIGTYLSSYTPTQSLIGTYATKADLAAVSSNLSPLQSVRNVVNSTGAVAVPQQYAVGDRLLVLISGEGVANAANGVYVVGVGGALTRAVDMLQGANAAGAYMLVKETNVSYVCKNNSSSATVGTDPLAFVIKEQTATYTANTGVKLSGSVFQLDYATSTETVSTKPIAANDTRLSDSRTPRAHQHVSADITDLNSSFAPANHNHDGVYAPVSHTHSGYASVSHNHDGT